MFAYHYIQPHTRAVPFLMGVGLGYALHKTRKSKVKMGRVVVCLGWVLSAILLGASVLGMIPYLSGDHQHDRLESSLLISFVKVFWAVGVVWVIWANANGYGGKSIKLKM